MKRFPGRLESDRGPIDAGGKRSRQRSRVAKTRFQGIGGWAARGVVFRPDPYVDFAEAGAWHAAEAMTSRRTRLASATPRPAVFKPGSIGSARVSASVPGGSLRGPAEHFAGDFQVVCGLEAEPKLRRCAKPAAKTRGGYRTLSVEDFGDARDWHLYIAGDRPSGQVKRRHEFVPQHIAGGYMGQPIPGYFAAEVGGGQIVTLDGHLDVPSVVIDTFDVERIAFVPAEAKPGVSKRYLDPIPCGYQIATMTGRMDDKSSKAVAGGA